MICQVWNVILFTKKKIWYSNGNLDVHFFTQSEYSIFLSENNENNIIWIFCFRYWNTPLRVTLGIFAHFCCSCHNYSHKIILWLPCIIINFKANYVIRTWIHIDIISSIYSKCFEKLNCTKPYKSFICLFFVHGSLFYIQLFDTSCNQKMKNDNTYSDVPYFRFSMKWIISTSYCDYIRKSNFSNHFLIKTVIYQTGKSTASLHGNFWNYWQKYSLDL